jgi:hypothetical protein
MMSANSHRNHWQITSFSALPMVIPMTEDLEPGIIMVMVSDRAMFAAQGSRA